MFAHRKPNSPPVIYLDQNKWIDLARAYHGDPKGAPYTPVLQKIQAAVTQRAARFPLSSIHVIESLKMGDAGRRSRLAQVMAEVSEGWTIAPPDEVLKDELKAAVPKSANGTPFFISPMVFGRGIDFAFAQPPALPELLNALDSANPQVKHNALVVLAAILINDEALRKPTIDQYNVLIGATAADVDRIRRLVQQRPRDLQRRQFVARLIIDRLSRHEHDLQEAVAPTGIELRAFISSLDQQRWIDLLDDIPTLHVEKELKDVRFAQYQRNIDAHDLHDMAFLSVAIPYADIVVTERSWVAMAQQKQLDQTYHTILLRDLAALEQHLVVPAPTSATP